MNNPKTPHPSPTVPPDSTPSSTSTPASAASRRRPSSNCRAPPAAPAASSSWPATCASPAPNTPPSASSRSAPDSPPGGGGLTRLPQLIGRGRALEVLLSADDLDAELAERYGYINRAIRAAELGHFVDDLARRIASFDKTGLAQAKAFVDQVTLPRNDTFAPQLDAFRAGIARPEVQARVAKLLQMGFNQASDLEHHLGRDIVLTGAPTDTGAPS